MPYTATAGANRMRWIRPVVAIVLGAGLCRPDGSGFEGAPMSLARFEQRASEVTCSKLFACHGPGALGGHFGNFGGAPRTERECRQLVDQLMRVMGNSIRRSRRVGRLGYRPVAAGACIRAVAAADCEHFDGGFVARGRPDLAPCGAFLMPRVPPGGRCERDEECTTWRCRFRADGPDRCARGPAVQGRGGVTTRDR